MRRRNLVLTIGIISLGWFGAVIAHENGGTQTTVYRNGYGLFGRRAPVHVHNHNTGTPAASSQLQQPLVMQPRVPVLQPPQNGVDPDKLVTKIELQNAIDAKVLEIRKYFEDQGIDLKKALADQKTDAEISKGLLAEIRSFLGADNRLQAFAAAAQNPAIASRVNLGDGKILGVIDAPERLTAVAEKAAPVLTAYQQFKQGPWSELGIAGLVAFALTQMVQLRGVKKELDANSASTANVEDMQIRTAEEMRTRQVMVDASREASRDAVAAVAGNPSQGTNATRPH